MQRGVATFTLDYGKCPRWLFERMVKLGREMTQVLVDEYGPDEFVKRIANPVWFQSLGTVLAFDWNASGLTTILTAALKEAIRGSERDLGLFICGGKGKTSRKTPDEIVGWGDHAQIPTPSINSLVYNSKMAAKVDSSLVQDGYQIYHHAFFFSRTGAWAVVQQGMNTDSQTARRYHWHSENVHDIVCEPHSGISTQELSPTVDLTARKSGKNREISSGLIQSQSYAELLSDMRILRKHSSKLSRMIHIGNDQEQLTLLDLFDIPFTTHPVVGEKKYTYLEKILYTLTETKPQNYEAILAHKGVGPATMRALSLVAEVIYGAPPSYEDPARYSFAHGGKDAIPYPVDTKTYDTSIAFFKKVVAKLKLSPFEKQRIVHKLEKKGSILPFQSP